MVQCTEDADCFRYDKRIGPITKLATSYDYTALLTVLKKWTGDLSMTKVALRRQIFEANVHWFTLILQGHGTKPLDDPVQQAPVRRG